MLKESLEALGHPCLTFKNAKDALAGLASSLPDVLITDISMSQMSGLELTKEAKRIRPDLIVIMMTGYIEDFSYDQAIEAGAADFIKKPFTIQELLMRVNHVKMQEKLRTISITDELTGLLNRRGFFALAEQQLKMAGRTKAEMALLFADVDSLKTVNDTFGHQEGDRALTAIADIFRETFRDSDILARMSGDEFAILLIDASEENISLITERLDRAVSAFNKRGHVPYTLSLSTGIVAFDGDTQRSMDALLKEADALMYREKLKKRTGGL